MSTSNESLNFHEIPVSISMTTLPPGTTAEGKGKRREWTVPAIAIERAVVDIYEVWGELFKPTTSKPRSLEESLFLANAVHIERRTNARIGILKDGLLDFIPAGTVKLILPKGIETPYSAEP